MIKTVGEVMSLHHDKFMNPAENGNIKDMIDSFNVRCSDSMPGDRYIEIPKYQHATDSEYKLFKMMVVSSGYHVKGDRAYISKPPLVVLKVSTIYADYITIPLLLSSIAMVIYMMVTANWSIFSWLAAVVVSLCIGVGSSGKKICG